MTDRNVQYPSRYKLTLVDGTSDVYELTPAPGEVSAEGTILNKANLLSDNTAQALGLPQADPTVNDALNQLSGKQDPWQLIDLLDNTGAMAGTWTAPDVFEGENYDLGVYEIGGGGSGAKGSSSDTAATGGASGYGKNFIINNVAPNTQYSYVLGAKGSGITSGGFGKPGGSTAFNGIETDGGDGGENGSSSGGANGASGGQGGDSCLSALPTNRQLFGCSSAVGFNDWTPGGSQSPRVGQNQFDTTMVTLSAGGWAWNGSPAQQTIAAMPDGTKGGDGKRNGNGENATGHGNGGGATISGTSGSGSDGAIFLYARRRSPVEYQVSITVLDQDDNPVDGIAINGLYSNAEGSRNGLAVTGSNGVATGISYQQQATFTTDAYTDLTSGSVSLVMTEGSVTEGTINVTFTNFVQWTASGTARFSHYVKRIDVSAAGGGGGGVQLYLTAGNRGDEGVSSGGAGGYAVQQTDVDFEPDTDYPVVVGSRGPVVTSVNASSSPKGGTSSVLGVSAEGGAGGNYSNMDVAAIGNGNGGATNGYGSNQSIAPTSGTQQIYSSFTEMKTVGGGGACGEVSTLLRYNAGAAPNGADGGSAGKDDERNAGTAGVAGGGGGMAYDYSEDSNGDYYHGEANASSGGRGEVAIRLYNTHTIPAS